MLFLFRIGSRPVLIVVLFVLVIFFSACSDSSENELTVFKALDESLTNSNNILNKQSETIYYALKDRLNEYGTQEKAKLWEPKAMLIKKLSANMFIYVDNLKKNLKIEAGLDKLKDNNSFREDDKNAVNTIFSGKGKGNDLHRKLREFKNDILSVNAEMDYAFRNALVLNFIF